MSELVVYLFVYGTLQLGFTNPFAQLLHQNSRCIGDGLLRGHLYDIGQYPGATHDPNSQSNVHGTVFDIGTYQDLLLRLDEYEGIGSPPNTTDEYIRSVVPISYNGNELPCWTYLYNWPVTTGQLILSGKYGESS